MSAVRFTTGWRPVSLSALLFASIWVAGCVSEPPINLIVLSLDTTRADHLGSYGYERAATPNIDSLAARGFQFDRHLTPVPITLPAHTTLFTGLTPPQHSVRDNGTFVVPDRVTTLAEVLSEAGYHTSAFVGAYPLHSQFNLDQGFDLYDDEFEGVPGPEIGENVFFDERPARRVMDVALDELRTLERRPFFSFLHFFDAHQPLVPPHPYDIDFRDRPYDGEIAYIDAQIGRLLRWLDEAELTDSTLVVVTADHGEGLGDHGELTHAMLLHQPTLHIPLILAGPGVPVGRTSLWTAAPQVFTTLLDLLDVALPESGDPAPAPGLGPVLSSAGERPQGWPRFEAYFETIAPRASHGWSQLTGWMRGDWRLVHAPRPELYQLDDDPEERRNLASERPSEASELFSDLAGYLSRWETESVGESAQEIDEETRQKLAALGYLQLDHDALGELDDMLDVSSLVDPKDKVVDISLISEARASIDSNDWNRSYELHRQLVERYPQSLPGLKGLAVLYGRRRDWTPTFEYLDRALAVSPESMELQMLKGQLLIDKGDAQAGLDILVPLADKVVSWRADAFHMWVGVGHSKLGRPDEAIASFERVLEASPDNRWVGLYLANELAAAGRHDEARGRFERLIELAPYFPLAYYNFALLLHETGESAAALRLAERSVRLDTRHAPSRQLVETLRRALGGSS